MMDVVLEVARILAVVALLCVAGALATPRGRLPLALRGMAKVFRITAEEQAVPVPKRLAALLLVLAAIALTLI